MDSLEYEKLNKYSKRAVYYGYLYRMEYEKQVSENGVVNVHYSLYQPDIWYEWLAMAALGGLVGTYATDLVKYVANKLLIILREKAEKSTLSEKERNLIIFLSDNDQLNKFTFYINNYYDGMTNIHSEVEKAIKEEEHADGVSKAIEKKLEKVLKKSAKLDVNDFKAAYSEARMNQKKMHEEKPSIKEMEAIFKVLKKQLKKEKQLIKESKKSK
jgi:hypothetical protein